jgi:hypothetical protein
MATGRDIDMNDERGAAVMADFEAMMASGGSADILSVTPVAIKAATHLTRNGDVTRLCNSALLFIGNSEPRWPAEHANAAAFLYMKLHRPHPHADYANLYKNGLAYCTGVANKNVSRDDESAALAREHLLYALVDLDATSISSVELRVLMMISDSLGAPGRARLHAYEELRTKVADEILRRNGPLLYTDEE